MAVKTINITYDACWLVVPHFREGYIDRVEVKPGLRVILALHRYVGPTNCYCSFGEEHYFLLDYASHVDRISGNLDPSKCKLNGWLGTTDDWALFARGAWVVESVGESRLWEERPYRSFPGRRMVRVVLKSF